MAWKCEEAADVEAVWDMRLREVRAIDESKVILQVRAGTRRVNPLRVF